MFCFIFQQNIWLVGLKQRIISRLVVYLLLSMYKRGERGTLLQILAQLMREFGIVTRVEAGLAIGTSHRCGARQILPLMSHEHIRQVKIALVDRVIDRINVVEAVRMHVAAPLAQQVHHGGMLRTHRQHQWRVTIIILDLQLSPVVEQKLGQLGMTILYTYIYSIQHLTQFIKKKIIIV